MSDDDRQALVRRLYALRGPLARAFARKVDDRSEIDDLVQEVFLRIIRRGALDHSEQFTAYVFKTADSVLKDRYRHRRVRHADRHVAFDAEVHAGHEDGPDAGLEARESLRASTLALMELPERTRAVFLLRRLDGASFAEIARRLGVSLSTAEKHMQLATRHLVTRSREGGWP